MTSRKGTDVQNADHSVFNKNNPAPSALAVWALKVRTAERTHRERRHRLSSPSAQAVAEAEPLSQEMKIRNAFPHPE